MDAIGIRITMETMRYPPYYIRGNAEDTRLEDAYAIVMGGGVTPDIDSPDASLFKVASSKAGKFYFVNGLCTCPSSQHSPKTGWCKHKIAVALWKRARQALYISAQGTEQPKDAGIKKGSTMERDAREPQPMMIPQLPPVGPRPCAAILADLAKPLPDGCIADIPGKPIKYIHWRIAARVLDMYAPGWSGKVTNLEVIGGKVTVTYAIAIPTQEGLVTREAIGQEDEVLDKKEYGDSTSNAEAMAFKRAAAKFGVAAALYDRIDATGEALTVSLNAMIGGIAKRIDEEVLRQGFDKKAFWASIFARYGTSRISGVGYAGLLAIEEAMMQIPSKA